MYMNNIKKIIYVIIFVSLNDYVDIIRQCCGGGMYFVLFDEVDRAFAAGIYWYVFDRMDVVVYLMLASHTFPESQQIVSRTTLYA